MKMGWQTKSIGDVCMLKSGTTVDKALEMSTGSLPYLKVADMSLPGNEMEIVSSSRFLRKEDIGKNSVFPIGTTIFPKRGGAILTNKKRLTSVPICADLNIMGVIPSEVLLSKFLYYYFLNVDMRQLGSGSSIPQINNYDIEPLVISFPQSLAEQQRIVDILDESFAGIAMAKANAEKNLQSARALLESHLDSMFSQGDDGWVDTTIGDQVLLQRGFDITKDQQNDGDIPVVSSGGIKSFHDKAMVKGPGVVIGRKGTLGTVFYLEEDFWPHDTTLWVKDFKGNNPRFVYYLFAWLDVEKLNSGTANPALNRNQVHPIKVTWPPVTLQKALVARLDSLDLETRRLESTYQRKIEALEELKKSLLHQAFSGQL